MLEAGAEPAGPGEFTKRAFLNGKRDLASAESVMSLISASGKQAAAAALGTLDGKLSSRISACRDKITGVCASLSAWVDYPDEEIEEISPAAIKDTFTEVRAELEEIIRRYDSGKAVTQGVDTVIVGKPNVGKSAVMNMLSGYDRSIVTDIAGTTRDVVEERVMLGDIVLNIADTAGMHDTENIVENIGVELAEKRLERASLVLAVFDGSNPLTDEDRAVAEKCRDKLKIALLNKSDLPSAADREEIEKEFDNVIEVSALTGEGFDELEKDAPKSDHRFFPTVWSMVNAK